MSNHVKSLTKKRNSIVNPEFLLGLLFFSFYLLGEFFPNYWWATHSSHFVNTGMKLSLFLSAFLLISSSLFPKFNESIIQRITLPSSYNAHVVIWSISIAMGVVFYSFPMVADFYGEAYLLNPQIHQTVPKVSTLAYNDLFSFGLNPWAGQKTIFAVITYLAHFSGTTLYETILYFDAFFGCCFLLIWLYFINNQLTTFLWKFVLSLAVCFAPFLLSFFGHLEINAPVLCILLLWTTQLVYYLQHKSSKRLWLLLFLLIVGLKLHAVALFFAPIWLVVCISHYSVAKGKASLISWKNSSLFLLAPIFLIGLFCYFFVFKDYNDPRNLDFTVSEYDRLFLPLISPEAPLDRYNLFSFNHIFDYFSELLLWSPIAVFLLVFILVLYRKEIKWHNESLVLVTSIFILIASLFFVTNPLLSMQMDWDLFSFPTPVLLVLVVLLIRQLETTQLIKKILPVSLALVLLNLPFFSVHFSEATLSRKLESLGIRIYHTYYAWSSQTIHNGLSLLSKDRNAQIERKNEVLYLLKEHALIGNDREYSTLWKQEGSYFLDVHKDVSTAYLYLEKALEYNPDDNYVRLLLFESSLLLDLPEQAYTLSVELKQNAYPTKENASIATVQAALNAEKYDKALLHAAEHVQSWPKDSTMQLIHNRLQNNIDVAQLRNFFFTPQKKTK